jgi:murein DD-endopeptidase MepM/ murein hydrolase activator NlpD
MDGACGPCCCAFRFQSGFGTLTAGFGPRTDTLLGHKVMHTGVDWEAPVGTAVTAAADGIVEAAGAETGYGNAVRLGHKNNYHTMYAHLSNIAAGMAPGRRVRTKRE